MKTYKGLNDSGQWPHFAWTVTLKGIAIDYKLGIGHSKVARIRPNTGYMRIDHRQIKPTIIHQIKKAGIYGTESLYIKKPKYRDVIYSLALDAQCGSDTFEDFCSNLGYDTDSRKALETYLECQTAVQKLRKLGYDLERVLAWEL